MRVFWGVALASCVVMTGCAPSANSAPSPTNALAVGTTAFPPSQRTSVQAVNGTTLTGKPLSLSDYKGKVVVVNVWGSWCSTCREESPALARLARSQELKGVSFVGLNVKDDFESAKSFAEFSGMSYPHLVDRDGRLLAALKVVPPSAIPSTLIIDRSGRVAVRVIGAVDPKQLAAAVKREVQA